MNADFRDFKYKELVPNPAIDPEFKRNKVEKISLIR